MSRRLFQITAAGTVVGPRDYYAKIAGRQGVKPRLAKKANKYIDIAENAWREGLRMKDMVINGELTFDLWNKQRRKIEALSSTFFRRRSFSQGLKEGYRVTVEYYEFQKAQGYN
ncbi:hypothetical protein PHABIO_197 [Pseudomonas phage Phabio]|uniref:Uncharacterized protein n=1 Tax=Pseudomonas phage Phabio TaxID=2006668 RepID=A0A1Y0T022_9CAUD|nr:hypothetical protein MZD05_gp197 [Pseudomonas phage Phabio]ARV76828.1 hypothetical protein PHABIO_197 [Pseudomonas phage Phabio]